MEKDLLQKTESVKELKICFVAPSDNYHIEKWCGWFSSHGHEVYVISFADTTIDGAVVYSLGASVDVLGNDLRKIKYLSYSGKIKRIVNEIQPDIVNVHYATSYGTATALSGLKGYVLSVWGSDVYDFPNKSPFHKVMLRFSLFRAEYIFSTSRDMARETGKYTNKMIEITPFGVDMEMFSPDKRQRKHTGEDFVVGTVKGLTPKYGIDYLLKAIAIIKNDYPQIPVKLRIAGKGSHEEIYKDLAKLLGIEDITTWLGFIPQEQAAMELANMDVGIVASDSESFGVSAVEAQACGIPVIISDVPGLMEATSPGKTSIVVPRKNEKALAEAIIQLYKDETLRIKMGKKGRDFVMENYELNHCFSKIENLLEGICAYKST